MECGWGFYLDGKKDALLASGLARMEWFPTGKARDKRGRVIRHRRTEHEGREVYCRDCNSGGRYSIRFDYTGEELELAKSQYQSRRDAERAPKTAAAFRAMCDLVAGVALFGLHRSAGYKADKNATFRFDDETLEAIHIEAMKIRDLLRDGRILKLRDPIDPARMDMVRAAEFDSSFQKFLRQLPAQQRGATKAQLEHRTTLVQKGHGPAEGETV
jgi:hypothetical protein